MPGAGQGALLTFLLFLGQKGDSDFSAQVKVRGCQEFFVGLRRDTGHEKASVWRPLCREFSFYAVQRRVAPLIAFSKLRTPDATSLTPGPEDGPEKFALQSFEIRLLALSHKANSPDSMALV